MFHFIVAWSMCICTCLYHAGKLVIFFSGEETAIKDVYFRDLILFQIYLAFLK